MIRDSIPGDDPNRAQARVFAEHLESVATQLEQQVTALEHSARMPGAKNANGLMVMARSRRLELYEARAHIDTLNTAFPPTP